MTTRSPELKSRKLSVAITLVIVSIIYAAWQYIAGAQQPVEVDVSSATSTSQTVSTQNNQVQTSATTATVPTQKSAGLYADGAYTGTPVSAYYGTVQVEAVVKNGALANIRFLQSPSDRSTSRRISGAAMPILVQEAIQNQTAQVDSVSGATDISNAFVQSLASALSQAKN